MLTSLLGVGNLSGLGGVVALEQQWQAQIKEAIKYPDAVLRVLPLDRPDLGSALDLACEVDLHPTDLFQLFLRMNSKQHEYNEVMLARWKRGVFQLSLWNCTTPLHDSDPEFTTMFKRAGLGLLSAFPLQPNSPSEQSITKVWQMLDSQPFGSGKALMDAIRAAQHFLFDAFGYIDFETTRLMPYALNTNCNPSEPCEYLNCRLHWRTCRLSCTDPSGFNRVISIADECT